MGIARWMAAPALVCSLAVAGCQMDEMEGGDTSIEDQDPVPAGAIPAPTEGSPANPAAAGVPLDSSAAPADSAPADSAATDPAAPGP